MKFSRNLYLCGFMGSGKTTLAPLLADGLSLEAVDLDALIELQAGMPIARIFATLGEDYFRQMESRILLRTAKRQGAVVALGGGALLANTNLQVVRRSGILIYLQAPIRTLCQRIIRNPESRPLLKDVAGHLDELKGLFRERQKNYQKANFQVEVDRYDPQEIVDQVIHTLEYQGLIDAQS